MSFFLSEKYYRNPQEIYIKIKSEQNQIKIAICLYSFDLVTLIKWFECHKCSQFHFKYKYVQFVSYFIEIDDVNPYFMKENLTGLYVPLFRFHC